MINKITFDLHFNHYGGSYNEDIIAEIQTFTCAYLQF